MQGNPSTKNANTQMNLWHDEQSLPWSRALTSLPTSRGVHQTMFFMDTSLLTNFASLALMPSFPSNPLRGKSWTLKVNCVTQTVRDIMPLWIGRHCHYSLYHYFTFPVLLFIKITRFSPIMAIIWHSVLLGNGPFLACTFCCPISDHVMLL